MRRLTIGELARRAGVGVETVRFYQRRGLLPEPPRQGRSIREYPADALALLQFIRRLRGFGFTLAEIEKMSAMRMARSEAVVPLLRAKATELHAQVRELEASAARLEAMTRTCEALPPAEQWQALDES